MLRVQAGGAQGSETPWDLSSVRHSPRELVIALTPSAPTPTTASQHTPPDDHTVPPTSTSARRPRKTAASALTLALEGPDPPDSSLTRQMHPPSRPSALSTKTCRSYGSVGRQRRSSRRGTAEKPTTCRERAGVGPSEEPCLSVSCSPALTRYTGRAHTWPVHLTCPG